MKNRIYQQAVGLDPVASLTPVLVKVRMVHSASSVCGALAGVAVKVNVDAVSVVAAIE